METPGNEQVGSQEQLYEALGMEAPAQETPPQEPTTETPPVEPAAGTPPQEPPVETPPVGQEETPPAEPSGATPTEPAPTIFEIDSINQEFETSFTDKSELKLLLDKAQRIEEMEGQVKELEKLKEENLLLKEKFDPMQYFSSEDEFKAALFKKQFPDKDATTAYQLFASDVDSMENADLIAYEMMLNTPGITKKDADLIIADKYGIDEGEIDPLNATKMKVDASTAKRNIDALKSQVNLPDKLDVDSLTQQQTELLNAKKEHLTKSWGEIGKEVERTLSDLTVSGGDGDDAWSFTYSMAKDFPSEVTQSMVDYFANTGQELTKEAVQQMGEAMQREYIYRNKDKIIQAVREDTLAKAEEQRLKKEHNPGEPNPAAPPAPDGASETSQKILNHLNAGFKPSSFMNK